MTFRLPREHLLPSLAWAGLLLLITGGIWFNVDLAWSLRNEDHAPPATLPNDPQSTAAAITHRHLFGQPETATGPAAAPPEFHLLGVLAGHRPEQGSAILLANGEKRPLIAHVGQTIAPGLRLTGLAPRQVTLSRHGVSQTLELPGPPAATKRSPPPSPNPVID